MTVPNARSSRRLEIVVDGLFSFGSVQLAVDTTLVSPLHCDGTTHRGVAHVNGVVGERRFGGEGAGGGGERVRNKCQP